MIDYFDGKGEEKYYRTMKPKVTKEWRRMHNRLIQESANSHTKAMRYAADYLRSVIS